MASPSAGAPALKYGYVNTVTTSPGEVKGLINPLASTSAGAPALNYGDVNTETISLGEVKGLIIFFLHQNFF